MAAQRRLYGRKCHHGVPGEPMPGRERNASATTVATSKVRQTPEITSRYDAASSNLAAVHSGPCSSCVAPGVAAVGRTPWIEKAASTSTTAPATTTPRVSQVAIVCHPALSLAVPMAVVAAPSLSPSSATTTSTRATTTMAMPRATSLPATLVARNAGTANPAATCRPRKVSVSGSPV